LPDNELLVTITKQQLTFKELKLNVEKSNVLLVGWLTMVKNTASFTALPLFDPNVPRWHVI
jgi:hypothetical protein